MIDVFVKVEMFIPYDCYQTVYDIDFIKLYELGNKKILIDIDNTLLPYDIDVPTKKEIEFINDLKKIGFEIILISNNHKKRVKKIANEFNSLWIYSAMKPLKKGFKKALKMFNNYDLNEIITIGDQIMTDVWGSNRMNMKCVLVKPIKKKNEKWYTKLNRISEKKIISKMKKRYPDVYEKIISIRGDKNEK